MDTGYWILEYGFGLYTQFICALFLLRYLKNTHREERNGKLSKHYWDENPFFGFADGINFHLFLYDIMTFVPYHKSVIVRE